MSIKSKVYFFFKTPVSLRDRTKLKKFIEATFRKEKKKLQSLNFIFCTDKDLLEINRQYLKHDFYTDIITFELSEKGAPIEGEVYISIDRVRDNSKKLKEPLWRELLRVIFHGVLHLSGYGDKGKKERKEMRKSEDLLIADFRGDISRDTVST
ncbi:MAG: rRNA maturation RNase YbeY [Chitinophagaceae bacterium]